MPSRSAANDGRDRPFEFVLDRKPDGRQPRAERQQGNQVGQQRADRNELKRRTLVAR